MIAYLFIMSVSLTIAVAFTIIMRRERGILETKNGLCFIKYSRTFYMQLMSLKELGLKSIGTKNRSNLAAECENSIFYFDANLKYRIAN